MGYMRTCFQKKKRNVAFTQMQPLSTVHFDLAIPRSSPYSVLCDSYRVSHGVAVTLYFTSESAESFNNSIFIHMLGFTLK